jgi:hypothetical protein
MERVGIKNNFFDLGGNSFLLMQVNTETEKLYPGCLSITDFFAYPTIGQLTGLIEKKRDKAGKAKAIQLETVPLPGDYFHPGDSRGGGETSVDFKFQVSGNTLKDMKTIARREGIPVEDILLAAYIYLFARLNGESRVVIQGMCREKGRIIPLAVNLDGITDFAEFFKQLVRQQEENDAGGYDIEDLHQVKLKKEPYTVIPFFYRQDLLSRGSDLSGIYDIVVEVVEQGRRLDVVCAFNNRLQEEKMKELMDLYLALNDFIISQCLEGSG